jgi:ankyrin repeat protein
LTASNQPPVAGAAAATSPQADALWSAARKGDAAAIKLLLDQGVDVNTRFRYGTTALFSACDHGQLDVVRLLLERGADPNVKDTFYGAMPLSWAWTASCCGRRISAC